MKKLILLIVLILGITMLLTFVSAQNLIIKDGTGGYSYVSYRDETPNCDFLKYFKEQYTSNSEYCKAVENGYYSSEYNEGNDGAVIINEYFQNIDNNKFIKNIKELYGSGIQERELFNNKIYIFYKEENSKKSTAVVWYSGNKAISIGAGPFDLSVSDDPLIAGILKPYLDKYSSSLVFNGTDENSNEAGSNVSKYLIKTGLGDYSMTNNGEEINCDLLGYLKEQYNEESDYCKVSAYGYYMSPQNSGSGGMVSVDESYTDIKNSAFVKYIREKYGSEIQERELLDNNVFLLYSEKSNYKSTTIIWHTQNKAILVFSGDFEMSVSDDALIGGFVKPYLDKYPSTLEFVSEDKILEPIKTPVEVSQEISQDEKKELCIGCIKENKCFPVGYRTSNEYCSGEQETFLTQTSDDASCNNNFECDSNLCIDDKCVSSGLWQKIMSWFSKLFGGE
jgi:hypothetical protein